MNKTRKQSAAWRHGAIACGTSLRIEGTNLKLRHVRRSDGNVTHLSTLFASLLSVPVHCSSGDFEAPVGTCGVRNSCGQGEGYL